VQHPRPDARRTAGCERPPLPYGSGVRITDQSLPRHPDKRLRRVLHRIAAKEKSLSRSIENTLTRHDVSVATASQMSAAASNFTKLSVRRQKPTAATRQKLRRVLGQVPTKACCAPQPRDHYVWVGQTPSTTRGH
jgi:hypothetical protein